MNNKNKLTKKRKLTRNKKYKKDKRKLTRKKKIYKKQKGGGNDIFSIAHIFSNIKLMRYSVLGYSEKKDGRKEKVKDDINFTKTYIVDPAGNQLIKKINGRLPTGVTGASEAIYNEIGVENFEEFSDKEKKKLGENEAVFKKHGEYKCIHIIGPNASNDKYSKTPDFLRTLINCYKEVFETFLNQNKKDDGDNVLHLIPISTGEFKGDNNDIQKFTIDAIFKSLDDVRETYPNKCNIHLCIYKEKEFPKYQEEFDRKKKEVENFLAKYVQLSAKLNIKEGELNTFMIDEEGYKLSNIFDNEQSFYRTFLTKFDKEFKKSDGQKDIGMYIFSLLNSDNTHNPFEKIDDSIKKLKYNEGNTFFTLYNDYMESEKNEIINIDSRTPEPEGRNKHYLAIIANPSLKSTPKQPWAMGDAENAYMLIVETLDESYQKYYKTKNTETTEKGDKYYPDGILDFTVYQGHEKNGVIDIEKSKIDLTKKDILKVKIRKDDNGLYPNLIKIRRQLRIQGWDDDKKYYNKFFDNKSDFDETLKIGDTEYILLVAISNPRLHYKCYINVGKQGNEEYNYILLNDNTKSSQIKFQKLKTDDKSNIKFLIYGNKSIFRDDFRRDDKTIHAITNGNNTCWFISAVQAFVHITHLLIQARVFQVNKCDTIVNFVHNSKDNSFIFGYGDKTYEYRYKNLHRITENVCYKLVNKISISKEGECKYEIGESKVQIEIGSLIEKSVKISKISDDDFKAQINKLCGDNIDHYIIVKRISIPNSSDNKSILLISLNIAQQDKIGWYFDKKSNTGYNFNFLKTPSAVKAFNELKLLKGESEELKSHELETVEKYKARITEVLKIIYNFCKSEPKDQPIIICLQEITKDNFMKASKNFNGFLTGYETIQPVNKPLIIYKNITSKPPNKNDFLSKNSINMPHNYTLTKFIIDTFEFHLFNIHFKFIEGKKMKDRIDNLKNILKNEDKIIIVGDANFEVDNYVPIYPKSKFTVISEKLPTIELYYTPDEPKKDDDTPVSNTFDLLAHNF